MVAYLLKKNRSRKNQYSSSETSSETIRCAAVQVERAINNWRRIFIVLGSCHGNRANVLLAVTLFEVEVISLNVVFFSEYVNISHAVLHTLLFLIPG